MNNSKELSNILDNIHFLKIFQAFRIAVHWKSMLIAFIAVVLICITGWTMDNITRSVVATGDGITELDTFLLNPNMTDTFIDSNIQSGERKGVFSTIWNFSTARFNGAAMSLLQFEIKQLTIEIGSYLKALRWVFTYHYIYCAIFAVFILAIISIAGGAVCRRACLNFAKGEKSGFFESLRFSTKKFFSFFATPILPFLIIFGIGIVTITVPALLANIPWGVGDIILCILLPIGLIFGLVITFITIGAIAGFNLMFPALAYEGSDCFDTMSRSIGYIYNRPWRMLFYTIIAIIYGTICYIFIRFFAYLLLFITRMFFEIGIFIDNSNKEAEKLIYVWNEPAFMNLLGDSAYNSANASWPEYIAIILVNIWVFVVIALVIAFILSFYFSVNTIIYSLLRSKVDGTNIEDVYIEPAAANKITSEEIKETNLNENREDSILEEKQQKDIH